MTGQDPACQKEIDKVLIEFDGTSDKSNVGANAILAVSIAAAKAASKNQKIPLYKHFSNMYQDITGETVNLDIIQEIVNKFDLKIEVGGGVRSIDSIQKYTDAGVEKVILGSAAIKDKNFLKEACEKFPNKIALGLDAKDGYLAVSGWKKNSNFKTLDFLKEVNDYGVSRLIYTDINKDGMKTSPNFEGTEKIANTSNFPVIISGGVSSIEDIKKAKELNNKNIEGIIVGKAIYDGDIKLEDLAKEIDA